MEITEYGIEHHAGAVGARTSEPRPSDYGLEHGEWRPEQLESIHWCARTGNVGLLEAPTGSGKTAIAKAASKSGSVIALCRTKNLQQENYGDEYGAAVLFGRGNYPCVHPDAEADDTGADCEYEPMWQCEYATDCPYMVAKDQAIGSKFTALNYAYYLTARWPREGGANVLFLDEAHQLPDITLDFAGCTITEKNQVEWGMPEFPEIVGTGDMLIQRYNPVDEAVRWLDRTLDLLKIRYKAIGKRDKKARARCMRLRNKLGSTLGALKCAPDDWYIQSGRRARKFRGGRQPGFIARPLTARHHFGRYFLSRIVGEEDRAAIAMSATIGDFPTFREELGIPEKAVRFRAVPNRWPVEDRPVHILDVPKMGRKATPDDFSHQADAIAQAILGCPSEWSGLVHVTRKREAALLAKRLSRRSLADRVWVTPGWDGVYTPTDEQVRAWNERRAKVPNSICVSWAMWEGYNGLDEKIAIAAKAPFPFLGDPYERERLEYSGRFYLQRTAYQLEQGLGRTRRGREEDYGADRGFVAIADGSWKRVRKYLSASLREAIVK